MADLKEVLIIVLELCVGSFLFFAIVATTLASIFIVATTLASILRG